MKNSKWNLSVSLFVVTVFIGLHAWAIPEAQGDSLSIDGKAYRTKKTFRMEYRVSTRIHADAEKIWALLTNAAEFPNWNSTIDSIQGQIAAGEKIKVHAKISPDRAFSLKVSTFLPREKMVWKSGAAPMFKGVRTYTLSPQEDGAIEFTMVEVLNGLMLPMIAGSLPDFRPSFEQYAADLKRAAESSHD